MKKPIFEIPSKNTRELVHHCLAVDSSISSRSETSAKHRYCFRDVNRELRKNYLVGFVVPWLGGRVEATK